MPKVYTQLYPPKPAFTDENIGTQFGKVFIVTGGNSGIGLQLVKLLYKKGAKVYVAGRSAARCEAAIASIQAMPASTPGQLRYLHLDLEDLNTIKRSAQDFLSQEDRLDILWNNAGCSLLNPKCIEKGYDMHMRINCVGPFLFTRFLTPILEKTAISAPLNSVRVVWASSIAVEGAPSGGIDIDALSKPVPNGQLNYTMSKVGNWFLASEFGMRLKSQGVVSITQNPGNLKTDIWDGAPWWVQKVMSITLHDPVYGAYTGLWAGLHPELTVADNGRYVIPWGRWHPSPREDIVSALKTVANGGTGDARQFWEWCEQQTKNFA